MRAPALCCALLLALAVARAAAPAPATVACRVLEVHHDAATGVTVALFHHQDAADQARLAELLRAHPEAAVEYQARDRAWRPAGLARLKSCFGRGLLILPPGSPALAPGDDFLLRFPGE
ncbi:MAG TPA: hypothetical protein VLT85_00145 [Terriglobales bacterium]|nr:hypothetical protein [Terriglobales bacterium]